MNVRSAVEDLLPKGGWALVGDQIMAAIDHAHAVCAE
jgi:hypothetical protein